MKWLVIGSIFYRMVWPKLSPHVMPHVMNAYEKFVKTEDVVVETAQQTGYNADG